jgi:hypothetical protein
MSSRNPLLVLIVGALALTPTSVVSATSASSEEVVLRGTTTFSSSRAGSITFDLPTRVDIRKDFDFDVEGSGRAYGFSFWKSSGKPGWVPGVEFVRLGLCKERGCDSKDGGGFAFVTGRYLPPGEYEMYVVADGAPVEVTFSVATLSGRAHYRAEAIAAELKTLTPTLDVSEGAQNYSAGAFTELEESDWGFFGMWALNRNDIATAYGSCAYSAQDDVPGAPEEVAFLPGCPLSDGFQFVNPGPNGGTVLTVSHHGGPEGQGGWFTAGSKHARYGAVAFWMDIP